MLRGPVQISVTALDAIVRRENLGEVHIGLQGEAIWRDAEGEREHLRDAVGELSRLGLAGPHGLDPDLRDSLVTLLRPAEEFFGWIMNADGSTSVLGASAGNESLLAIRTRETISLRPLRPGGLAEAVVAQLPPVHPAHGRSFNLPESVVTQASQHRARPSRDEGFAGFGAAEPRENQDVKQLAEILAQEHSGLGELHAAVRDRGGRRYAVPFPVNYFDTPGGRWMARWTKGRAGERWLIAAPATPQGLVDKLYEMQRELVHG